MNDTAATVYEDSTEILGELIEMPTMTVHIDVAKVLKAFTVSTNLSPATKALDFLTNVKDIFDPEPKS